MNSRAGVTPHTLLAPARKPGAYIYKPSLPRQPHHFRFLHLSPPPLRIPLSPPPVALPPPPTTEVYRACTLDTLLSYDALWPDMAGWTTVVTSLYVDSLGPSLRVAISYGVTLPGGTVAASLQNGTGRRCSCRIIVGRASDKRGRLNGV